MVFWKRFILQKKNQTSDFPTMELAEKLFTQNLNKYGVYIGMIARSTVIFLYIDCSKWGKRLNQFSCAHKKMIARN